MTFIQSLRVLPAALLCGALIFLNSSAFAQTSDNILGVWLTQEQKSKIEIFKKGDKFFGKVIWLRDPLNDEGQPKVDKNNPDESMIKRPIMGLEILQNFEFDDKDMWEDGKIYDPTNGKTYSCQMEIDEGELEVTGYVGFSWIGRTVRWTRVTE